ncbi:MAG: hypothetical protein ACI8YQ_005318 [Polaribacter sp.]|jgi:hypothetical protein
MTKDQLVQLQFDGYAQTPMLWEGELEGLNTFVNMVHRTGHYSALDDTKHIRLGKLIEQFVLFELGQNESISILKANVQIFKDQITIGELDCLHQYLDQYIHLEIVYKFYLYDPSFPDELDRWIGPNRNDSLVQKLKKLREKQLPLLYAPETKTYMDKWGLDSSVFIQQLHFKAQLYVPIEMMGKEFSLVNNACVAGFYLLQNQLTDFQNHTFYIPGKLDWLVVPHSGVPWWPMDVFQEEISELLSAKKSPLCWMKSPEGEMSKFFVVWWD